VLVHGLFADGSSWFGVIPRLQAAGLNVTSVQNPLTTLPEAVDSALRVLARQDGPTVLAGHSFSGMIVTVAVPKSPAHRQNRPRGMAVEAELVRSVHGRPDD
jgi:pimeloyl-ACP methyl ester carboxylesterase